MIYSPIPVGRICRICGSWKNRSELTSCSKSRYGVRQLCKRCASARRKETRHQNPQPARLAAQRWRDRHPDTYRESRKRYYKTIPPEIRRASYKRAKARRPEHYKELARRTTARWRRKYPEQHVLDHNRRKARKALLPSTFAASDWQNAIKYFGGRCAACGRSRGFWNTLAQDHWIPLVKGGGYTRDNIVPLCNGLDGCNQTKSDRDPIEWLTDRFGPRKAKQILKRIQDYFEWVKQQDD